MPHSFPVKSIDGKILYSLVYDDRGNRADPSPVFCVHGLGLTRQTFDVLAEALVARNRRVIQIDLVGHGESEWADDPLRYYPPLYAEDCKALLDTLGLSSVDWIGISLGGLVGVRAIAEQHVPARRFVMVDVAPEVPLEVTAFLADWFERINIFPDQESFVAWRLERMAEVGPLTDEQRRARALRDGRALPDGTWTDICDKRISVRHRMDADAGRAWNDWALYDTISCPTLVFHGENSAILPAPFAEEMTRRGPKARLVHIPGVGHYPALSDPFQIETLASFLEAAF